MQASDLRNLERYLILMYDRYSIASSVDEARLDLFSRKQKPYNAIPPTQASLRAHAKRAAYQATGSKNMADLLDDIPSNLL